MKLFLFITFLITIAKGGIWIGIGIIIRKHFDALLTLILRKPLPEGIISKEQHESMNKIIEWIGLCIITIGVLTIFFGLITLISGSSMTHGNFNFKL